MHDHTPEGEARRNALGPPDHDPVAYASGAPAPSGAPPAVPYGPAESRPGVTPAPPQLGGDPAVDFGRRDEEITPPQPPDASAPPAGLPGGPRLLLWLLILGAGGAVSLIFQLQEAAILIALSGLFVAAQAADLYPGQRYLYGLLSWTVPVIGAGVFSAIAYMVSRMEPSLLQMTVVAVAAASALACLLTMLRPIADALSLAMFPNEPPSHALRLAARIVVMGLMLAFPGWYAFRDMFEQMLTSSSLFDQGFIGSGLLGYVVLALASVGFMVRRDLSATLERLGLRPLASSDYAVIPLGVLLLFGLNLALETVQRTWFTDMWLSDQRVSQLIAAQLGLTQILMLGLSAGVGEEITLRGALQPRLGIWLTSLLFAALHIQYSWFGMGVIFCFGMLLGFIRMRTSTSVVMAIHTLYDIAAVVSMPGPT
jgi:hypothetical protein